MGPHSWLSWFISPISWMPVKAPSILSQTDNLFRSFRWTLSVETKSWDMPRSFLFPCLLVISKSFFLFLFLFFFLLLLLLLLVHLPPVLVRISHPSIPSCCDLLTGSCALPVRNLWTDTPWKKADGPEGGLALGSRSVLPIHRWLRWLIYIYYIYKWCI